MLQSRLHNKMCSLPQHTANSKSCHSSSLHLKLLEQITVGGGAQLLQVFMIKVWQYLSSWSNKSVIMACFSQALLKEKHCPVFINICLPVYLLTKKNFFFLAFFSLLERQKGRGERGGDMQQEAPGLGPWYLVQRPLSCFPIVFFQWSGAAQMYHYWNCLLLSVQEGHLSMHTLTLGSPWYNNNLTARSISTAAVGRLNALLRGRCWEKWWRLFSSNGGFSLLVPSSTDPDLDMWVASLR